MWKLRERKARLYTELLAGLGDRRRRGRERRDGSRIDSITLRELEGREFKDSARARRRRRTGKGLLFERRALGLLGLLLLLPVVILPARRRSRALLLVVLPLGAGLWSLELGLRGELVDGELLFRQRCWRWKTA